MEFHPPLYISVLAIEKRTFGSPSTKVTNFIFTYLWKQYLNNAEVETEHANRSLTDILTDNTIEIKELIYAGIKLV